VDVAQLIADAQAHLRNTGCRGCLVAEQVLTTEIERLRKERKVLWEHTYHHPHRWVEGCSYCKDEQEG